jgi:hypothetical protein
MKEHVARAMAAVHAFFNNSPKFGFDRSLVLTRCLRFDSRVVG